MQNLFLINLPCNQLIFKKIMSKHIVFRDVCESNKIIAKFRPGGGLSTPSLTQIAADNFKMPFILFSNTYFSFNDVEKISKKYFFILLQNVKKCIYFSQASQPDVMRRMLLKKGI